MKKKTSNRNRCQADGDVYVVIHERRKIKIYYKTTKGENTKPKLTSTANQCWMSWKGERNNDHLLLQLRCLTTVSGEKSLNMKTQIEKLLPPPFRLYKMGEGSTTCFIAASKNLQGEQLTFFPLSYPFPSPPKDKIDCARGRPLLHRQRLSNNGQNAWTEFVVFFQVSFYTFLLPWDAPRSLSLAPIYKTTMLKNRRVDGEKNRLPFCNQS